MIPRRHLLCFTIAILGVWALVAHAQESDNVKTFGTQVTAHVIPGTLFSGFELTFGDYLDSNENGGRACAVNNCWMIAPVMLPAGASIKSIEALICDQSAASDALVKLLRSPSLSPPVILASVTTTGITLGCQLYSAVLPTPETVNNLANTYNLKVEFGDDAGPSRPWLQFVRVYYALQVSPPPAVATFSDVPTTHPFFAFVEAFVKAGITSGCGAGVFCPDATVTRGQMAVFFSRGLGLHFAP